MFLRNIFNNISSILFPLRYFLPYTHYPSSAIYITDKLPILASFYLYKNFKIFLIIGQGHSDHITFLICLPSKSTNIIYIKFPFLILCVQQIYLSKLL